MVFLLPPPSSGYNLVNKIVIINEQWIAICSIDDINCKIYEYPYRKLFNICIQINYIYQDLNFVYPITKYYINPLGIFSYIPYFRKYNFTPNILK